MKLNESILQKLKESEGRTYEVVVGFCGYIGVEQEYNVYANSKADAVCKALDNPGSEAEMELNADDITDNGDGTFDVTVSYAGLIGAENTYTVTAEDESEAEMNALEEAKGDLEILSVDGEEFSYDETFECAKRKKKKQELKEEYDNEEDELYCCICGNLIDSIADACVEDDTDPNPDVYCNRCWNERMTNEGAKVKEDREDLKESDNYEAEKARLNDIAAKMQELMSHYGDGSRVTASHDNERMRIDISPCRFKPESFSKYENEPQIYGSVELDKDFNFVNVDINTTSGPNVINGEFITALKSLHTFISSNGEHYEG